MTTLNKCKITVLIVSYNHNDVIGRALESVLMQKEFGLYEIVICDDCSIDNNWDIISKYVDLYPNTIKAYRNENNLGIYANVQKLVSLRGEADIFYMLAGDDALCDGIFKEVQSMIKNNNIDVITDSAAMYFDWKSITPDGKETVFRNNMISKGHDAFSLKIRGLIYNRSVFLSEKVFQQFKPVVLDKGIPLAESSFDIQYQIYAQKNYYHSYVGTIYYSNIGISTKLNTNKYREEIIYRLEIFLSQYDFSNKDKMYVYFQIHLNKFYNAPSFKKLFATIKYYIASIKLEYNINFKRDTRLLLSMIKKMMFRSKK